ncbi:Ribosomal protein L20 mitochondrial protein [Dioscorea alata]|uniref:Ribosomal protein L20 mitochondrial protein n=1 Tax=Dioscorea alata TaxID=55571 RepID=A0ACB7VJ13_DIOAL|nr:Ribosomal protein L20 mitochondrial protein [Dioscorea alata]
MLASARTLLLRRLSLKTSSISRVPFVHSFSSASGSGDGGANDDAWGGAAGGASVHDWGEEVSSWSTGLTKDHFDGEAVGRQVSPSSSGQAVSSELAALDEEDEILRMVEKDNKENKAFVDGWKDRMMETYKLLKQVREPGVRGEYLKDSEKTEMYRLHKEDPETYTVERLAKDYRIMRQRVHAILWLKEMEEEEEKKLGRPLDDSVEILLDNFPEFFNSHDREFHVASLPYKPDFKVMPEGWDGKTRDPDEVLYEISVKEDQMLYEEFVQRLNFNKKKVAGEVKCHKYSRRRPAEGWSFTVEKMGPRDKRGSGGGWKFVSMPDGSSRSLNEMEKMYVKRETPKRRRRILPPFK